MRLRRATTSGGALGGEHPSHGRNFMLAPVLAALIGRSALP
jgi:hypothetical protein